MSNPTTRHASRLDHTCTTPNNIEHINCGSLQRIADATERMAGNYTALQNELDRYKTYYRELSERLARRDKTISSLKGQITKLKKKIQP
jgi:predicted  nucleic acid-binding Zn-ribbon protein